MPFNDMLKKLRLNKGITQDELSKETRINRSTLGMYESGKREPKFEILEQLADYFNVDMDYLLDRSSPATPTKSLSAIINNALKAKDQNLDWLEAKTGISKQYLRKIDEIYPTEDDYGRMSAIAQAIGIDATDLRKALASQEPPIYDGPVTRPEDDFEDLGYNKVSDVDFKRAQAQLLSIGINAARIDEDPNGEKGDFVVLSLFYIDPADPYGSCGMVTVEELDNVLARIDRILSTTRAQYQQAVKQNLYNEFLQDTARQRAVLNQENYDDKYMHIKILKK